jgi:4,5-dihydroxyphthalate decarboxylase
MVAVGNEDAFRMTSTNTKVRLRAVLGDHPHTKAIKSGAVHSNLVELEFIPFSPTNTAFKPMVREQRFDVCEMAIVTYLMAKAYAKPLVLLPATMLGRFQHAYAIANGDRGTITPADLGGRRVGIRSFTTTTGAWIRGILANDYGVDLNSIRWVTFEDPHVAEYVDTTERAPPGRGIIDMLMDGELDAVLGETSPNPKLKPLFSDPAAEAKAWYAKHAIVPVNHLVVVTEQLAASRPDVVAEVYRMLMESKAEAPAADGVDLVPFGLEATRRPLELITSYAAQQNLIPRPYRVEELFGGTQFD